LGIHAIELIWRCIIVARLVATDVALDVAPNIATHVALGVASNIATDVAHSFASNVALRLQASVASTLVYLSATCARFIGLRSGFFERTPA
jgi:hypothetical protein